MISIIVPTYLEGKHIEACLKSIKEQESNQKLEIITVDSNSSDKTREIARKYADHVINIKKRGVGMARNVGARIAKGDILAFVDADTLLHKYFLKEMEKAFESDNRLVCATGYVTGVNEGLGILSSIYSYFWFSTNNVVAILSAYLNKSMFPTVCCCCRKDVFETMGGFNENLAVGEDIDFSRRINKLGKCRLIKGARAFTSTRRIRRYGMIKNLYLFLGNYVKISLLKENPWVEEFPHVE